MYDPELTRPMRQELVNNGVIELKTPKEVDEAINNTKGTFLIIINSVCGCGAGTARPGVILSLKNKKLPAKIFTVFAGVDREATEKARTYFQNYAPSSPSMFLFKNNELVFALERSNIEGKQPEAISILLTEAFNKYC